MTDPIADFPYTIPEPLAVHSELPIVLESASPTLGRRESSWLHQVTIADGLVALAVLIAAVLRFSNLGGPVLSPAESTSALSSWQFGQAGATVTNVTSPAYFTLTNAAMLLFGSGDAIARLVPALLGTLSVALIWLLRKAWGPAGIVTTAIFLALSPLNVLSSRTAGGSAAAIFALLLLVAAGIGLVSDGRRRWAYMLGGALGLGFTSDPLFISGLVAIVPLWIWLARSQDAAAKSDPVGPLVDYWRPIAVAFSITFLVLSTSFFLYTPGLGATFNILAEWLEAFSLPSVSLASNGLALPFISTLRYEPALIVLGLPALIWAFAGRNNLSWLIAGWWVVLAAMAVVQPSQLIFALVFTVPGYLLIGLLARGLYSQLDDLRITLAVAGGLILLGMILLVSIARYTRLALWSSDQVAFLVLALIAFVAAGSVLVLAMSYNSRAARQGAFLGLAVLLLYGQWGSATTLAQSGSNDPRERVVIVGTDDDVRVLTDLIRSISLQSTGGDHDLDLISTLDSPILRWYLRDYEMAQFGTALPIHASPEVVIAPASADLRIGNDYMGADFGLQQTSSAAVAPFTLNDSLKWLLFHESTAPIEIERIILWVRSDLTGAGR